MVWVDNDKIRSGTTKLNTCTHARTEYKKMINNIDQLLEARSTQSSSGRHSGCVNECHLDHIRVINSANAEGGFFGTASMHRSSNGALPHIMECIFTSRHRSLTNATQHRWRVAAVHRSKHTQKRKLLAKLVAESVPETISNVHSTASLHHWGTSIQLKPQSVVSMEGQHEVPQLEEVNREADRERMEHRVKQEAKGKLQPNRRQM